MEEDYQVAIIDRDSKMQIIHYENVSIQGETRVKDQQMAALQRRYVGYLENDDKNNVRILSMRGVTREQSILIYLHADNMAR